MIRTVQPADAPALKRVCETALGHKTTVEQLRLQIAALASDGHYFIAIREDDETGQIDGFIQAQRYNLLYGGDGWNIIALAVDPSSQGRGVGRRLLAALEDHARAQGCAFVRLNCNVVRGEAHGFYEHLGYRCDKTQKRFIKRLEP